MAKGAPYREMSQLPNRNKVAKRPSSYITRNLPAGVSHPSTSASPSSMPIDNSGKYWVRGGFQEWVISRMSRTTYSHARNSTRLYPQPYPTFEQLATRMDSNADESWFKDAGDELHTSNFVLLARMQTARRMSQRAARFPGQDMVLERLMAEGTFDRRDPNVLHTAEAFAMQHASAMVNRVLMRVEYLELEVSTVAPPWIGSDVPGQLCIAKEKILAREKQDPNLWEFYGRMDTHIRLLQDRARLQTEEIAGLKDTLERSVCRCAGVEEGEAFETAKGSPPVPRVSMEAVGISEELSSSEGKQVANETRAEQAGWYSPYVSDDSCLDLAVPLPVQVERRGIGWMVAARARLEFESEEEEIQRHVSRMRMRNEGDEDTLVDE